MACREVWHMPHPGGDRRPCHPLETTAIQADGQPPSPTPGMPFGSARGLGSLPFSEPFAERSRSEPNRPPTWVPLTSTPLSQRNPTPRGPVGYAVRTLA